MLDEIRIKEMERRNKIAAIKLKRRKGISKDKVLDLFDAAYDGVVNRRIVFTRWQAALTI